MELVENAFIRLVSVEILKSIKINVSFSFYFSHSYGLVDNKYIFYMDVLQSSSNQNHMPNQGDTVYVNAITSHQKIDDQEFFYRCINLVKIRTSQQNNGAAAFALMADEHDEEPESDDEIDNDDCGMNITKSEALKVVFDGEQKEKKTIELKVVNTSDRKRRISQATFRNQILASQIECNQLYSPHDIKPGGHFIYRIEVIGILSGVFKIKMDFKIDNKHLVRRCITLDVKNADEIEGARLVHSKAYTKNIYSEKRDVVKGHGPVSAPHFIDNR